MPRWRWRRVKVQDEILISAKSEELEDSAYYHARLLSPDMAFLKKQKQTKKSLIPTTTIIVVVKIVRLETGTGPNQLRALNTWHDARTRKPNGPPSSIAASTAHGSASPQGWRYLSNAPRKTALDASIRTRRRGGGGQRIEIRLVQVFHFVEIAYWCCSFTRTRAMII